MFNLKPDDFIGKNDVIYWISICVRCWTECFIDNILFHIHRSLEDHTLLFPKLWKFIWLIMDKWLGLNSIPKWIIPEHIMFQEEEICTNYPFLSLALIRLSLNISSFSLSTWQPILQLEQQQQKTQNVI